MVFFAITVYDLQIFQQKKRSTRFFLQISIQMSGVQNPKNS